MSERVTLHRLSASIMEKQGGGYKVHSYREICEATKGRSVYSIPREIRHKRLPIGSLMKPLEGFEGCFVIWCLPDQEEEAKTLLRNQMEKWVAAKLLKAQAIHEAWTNRNK